MGLDYKLKTSKTRENDNDNDESILKMSDLIFLSISAHATNNLGRWKNCIEL